MCKTWGEVIKSLTKIRIDNDTIKRLFSAAGIDGVREIFPLVTGEFNSVFRVDAGSFRYVLKVAPHENTQVLTYENNLLRHEIDTCEQMRGKTPLKIPTIYYADCSKKLIPAEFFIMEWMDAPALSNVKPSKKRKTEINARLGAFLGELHKIKGSGFGYPQNGLHGDWYQALKAMIQNLITDAAKKNKKLRGAERLLKYVERYKTVLLSVKPSVLVNFDLWDPNIFYGETSEGFELSLIDPERSFFGDGIGDFVALDYLKPIEKKRYLFDAYNKTSDTVVRMHEEEKIRYYIMSAYLAMIMQTEKYYRYKKTQVKYWVHTLAARLFRSNALRNLKKLSKSK